MGEEKEEDVFEEVEESGGDGREEGSLVIREVGDDDRGMVGRQLLSSIGENGGEG